METEPIQDDNDSGIDQADIDNAKLSTQRRTIAKKVWQEGVKKSAIARSNRKKEKDMKAAKLMAINDLETKIKEAENDIILRQQQARLLELENQKKSLDTRKKYIEEREPEPDIEHEPVKPVKKTVKPVKNTVGNYNKAKFKVDPISDSSDSEVESMISEPVEKIYKKAIVRRQVENRVDKIRDELIKKYMNGLFPQY